MADLPLNRQPLSTLAEVVAIAGDIIRYDAPLHAALLGIGGVYLSPYVDVSAYPELRLRALADVASAAGGIVMTWSLDGLVAAPGVPAAITAAALAGAIYDSGPIARDHGDIVDSFTLQGYAFPDGKLRLTVFGPDGEKVAEHITER